MDAKKVSISGWFRAALEKMGLKLPEVESPAPAVRKRS